MSERKNMEARSGADNTDEEAEVDITVTWKGEVIRRARKGLWWSQVTKEEILSEIEEAIDRIGEE